MNEVRFDIEILEYKHKDDDVMFLRHKKNTVLNTIKVITDEKIRYCESISSGKISPNYTSFQKTIASFGGRISGESRSYKQALIEYIANSLFDQNHEELNCLSVRELRIFFKFFFGNAPTQTFFKRHSGVKPSKDFYNLTSFSEHLTKVKNTNQDILKLVNWYEKEYLFFRDEVSNVKESAREKAAAARSKIVK